MKQYCNQLTRDGKASVVRYGYQPEREILTGIGSVPVKITKGTFKRWIAGDLSFCKSNGFIFGLMVSILD